LPNSPELRASQYHFSEEWNADFKSRHLSGKYARVPLLRPEAMWSSRLARQRRGVLFWPVQKNWLYTILGVGDIILAAIVAYSILGWTGMR
jgi:hypothetical protein